MNRIVIVTGGSKGIGFATAKKFLSCGDKVIILGRHENESALEELKKKGKLPSSGLMFPLQMTAGESYLLPWTPMEELMSWLT